MSASTSSETEPEAIVTRSPESRRRGRQVFLNGEVHKWYRLVLGYSDRAVSFLIEQLGIGRKDVVLDPFCGTGTTLVECMKLGIPCVGVDANPSSCFAARVKTDWSLSPATLLGHLDKLESLTCKRSWHKTVLTTDPTFQYIQQSGMIERGWISADPLEMAVAIKRAIRDLRTKARYKNAYMLALIAEVVEGASNIKFGPELYCGPARVEPDVFRGFADRVRTMAADLNLAQAPKTPAVVIQGDARDLASAVGNRRRFSAVISSPPYPAEHDYTRNARLELAFLEHVLDRDSLRKIKREMIRCHTKGIYSDDNDSSHIVGCADIDALANRIQARTKGKTHKFAPLYPAVIRHYFGGMKRHLASLWTLLRPSARCAYVVGDQAGYLRVPIQTADLLAGLAEGIGYEVDDVVQWRGGQPAKEARPLHENILILRKPATG